MAIHTSSDIIAQRYVVSSSVSHYTSSAASGSHIFGDSPDDTHQFTGSLLISGSSIALGDGNNNTLYLLQFHTLQHQRLQVLLYQVIVRKINTNLLAL